MMQIKNYFLIIFLITAFMLLYVYVNKYSQIERFNVYIIPQDKLAIIQGVNMPNGAIGLVLSFDKDPSAPPIDGNDQSPSQMFTFAFNRTSPECCMDSEFSTSQGCVCLTDMQKNGLVREEITTGQRDVVPSLNFNNYT